MLSEFDINGKWCSILSEIESYAESVRARHGKWTEKTCFDFLTFQLAFYIPSTQSLSSLSWQGTAYTYIHDRKREYTYSIQHTLCDSRTLLSDSPLYLDNSNMHKCYKASSGKKNIRETRKKKFKKVVNNIFFNYIPLLFALSCLPFRLLTSSSPLMCLCLSSLPSTPPTHTDVVVIVAAWCCCWCQDSRVQQRDWVPKWNRLWVIKRNIRWICEPCVCELTVCMPLSLFTMGNQKSKFASRIPHITPSPPPFLCHIWTHVCARYEHFHQRASKNIKNSQSLRIELYSSVESDLSRAWRGDEIKFSRVVSIHMKTPSKWSVCSAIHIDSSLDGMFSSSSGAQCDDADDENLF